MTDPRLCSSSSFLVQQLRSEDSLKREALEYPSIYLIYIFHPRIFLLQCPPEWTVAICCTQGCLWRTFGTHTVHNALVKAIMGISGYSHVKPLLCWVILGLNRPLGAIQDTGYYLNSMNQDSWFLSSFYPSFISSRRGIQACQLKNAFDMLQEVFIFCYCTCPPEHLITWDQVGLNLAGFPESNEDREIYQAWGWVDWYHVSYF